MTELRTDAVRPQMDFLTHGILEASTDCIELLDRDGTIEFLNGAGNRLLELESPEALLGTCWIEKWPEAARADAESALHAAQQGGHGRFTGCSPSRNGRMISWDVSVSPVRGANGDIYRLVVVSRDITAARQAFEEVDIARKNLDAVLSSTTDSVIAVDANWTIRYINRRASAFLGQNGALTVGENLWEAYPEEIGSVFEQNYRRALESQSPVHFEGYVTQLETWLEVHAFPTDDGLSIFFRDVTEAKRTRDEVHYLAHHDALTGLTNRAVFLKRFEAAQEAAARLGTELAVIYVDLDDFKVVNDTLGHDAGDALLVETSRRLQAGLGGRGLVARIGGDEFAILLDEDADRSGSSRLAEELQRRLAHPFLHENVALSCRASFGIALYPEGETRPSGLMKNADLALYKAKRSGGNQLAFFDSSIREAMQRRVSALSCAREALLRDAIVPFYQPKVSMKTEKVAGFEALLRWVHPREGVQPPFLIKEAFEDPVLSIDLGRRMLARVIRDMQRWRDNGVEFGSVAINVAAPEFVRRNLAAEVLEQLAAARLPATSLEIEVTENVFLDDGSENVGNALAELHRAGVSIALDDFGTGYASLAHLSRFPVSWLKVDRSFVARIDVDPDSQAIIKAIMGLSHGIGISVVAEGVETMRQWTSLKRKGCDVAQGYLISKPMTAELVPGFLADWAGVDRDVPGDGTSPSTCRSERGRR